MKHSLLLIRPQAKDQTLQKEKNIFLKAKLVSTLPAIHKIPSSQRQFKSYDFVGPTEFKLQKFFNAQKNQSIKENQINQQNQKYQQHQNQSNTGQFSKFANRTINRETILSKLSKHQQVQATKQRRNINRHKQYQIFWQSQANTLKRLINKKNPSFIEVNNKIIINQNPDKDQIIKDYVVNYWEMSLRNHNPILKKHIKGNRYEQIQLEKKLQMNQGIRQVQASIPKLPIQSLKRLQKGELSLTGRSKSVIDTQSITERSSRNQSLRGDLINQEQVYKINYLRDKKWQGTENLYDMDAN